MINGIQFLMRRINLKNESLDIDRYHLSQAMIEYQLYMQTAIEDGEELVTKQHTKKQYKPRVMKVATKATIKKSNKK